jgi:hypothetical protein
MCSPKVTEGGQPSILRLARVPSTVAIMPGVKRAATKDVDFKG